MTILMVGKTREGFIREGLEFYQKRLKPLMQLSLKSVREEKEGGGLSPETLKSREGERLLAQAPPKSCLVALDPQGQGIHHRRIRRLAQPTGRAGPAAHLPHRRPLGLSGRGAGRGRGAPGPVPPHPDP